MGLRGAPPKPLPLRKLHGEKPYRADLVEPEPRPLTEADPPKWFTPRMREVWNEVIQDLGAMGVLKQCDVYMVVAFVKSYVTFEEAAIHTARHGSIIDDPDTGRTIRNPALMAQRDALTMVRAFGRELGMSPASRTMMATRATNDDLRDAGAKYLTG